ncbi:MAG: hypothetical protein HPY45_14305 [Anaerolineae bacterium]|nr:hypothetical protein [Anaerolineae bacterium]
MKTYQKLRLWTIVVWLLLAGCGQAVSPQATPEPPPPQPSPTPVLTATTPQQENPSDEWCRKIAFALASETVTDIFSICPDGSRMTKLTDSTSMDTMPAWSPDGKRIAFASNRTGSSQIFIMDANGNNPIQITFDGQNDFPIWLPDSRQIAFRTSDGQGLWWWRIVDIESQRMTQFSQPSYDFFFQTPAWSPDGKKIAYMSLLEQQQRNDGSSQIHVKNVDGTNDTALTHDTWANIHPVWSPDGSQIAFLSERDGTYNLFALYVMSSNGQNIRKLSDAVFSESATLSWSPDGREIAIDSDASTGKIFIVDVSTANQRELLSMKAGERASRPSWQP